MTRHLHALTALSLRAGDARLGEAQRSGPMTVIPLFGPERGGYAPPRTGLKLFRVDGYGNLELENQTKELVIVPLHVGYIQKGAQNHAMCRAAFIAAGQKVRFEDACCVQEAQGGYLAERDQWFFVLPLALREAALDLQGRQDYSKLWSAITAFNQGFQKARRGHLELVIGNDRGRLNRLLGRFERLQGQTGALFFLRDELVGVEITPNSAYFAEVWPALVVFSYGTAVYQLEAFSDWSPPERPALAAGDLDGLRKALGRDRHATWERLQEELTAMRPQKAAYAERDKYLDLTLSTLKAKDYAGQVVHDGDRLVYASVFARQERVAHLMAA